MLTIIRKIQKHHPLLYIKADFIYVLSKLESLHTMATDLPEAEHPLRVVHRS